MSVNERILNSKPVWVKNKTATTTQGTTSSVVITPYLDSKYVIIQNQSGGNVYVCPEGTTTGILLTPGETFETELGVDAKFSLTNMGSGNVVMLWLF